ncbi:DUF6456 domain-containing protein [Ancylobacter amanitiformis]|uniref:DUF6456 domain-containing protein n=1 Tax=Ancylobacter amanitiformis TaxID=217069 RepID=A0ABU0LVM1_9HYPH|nr:DUF6456 domain-containing protein [Ancylobacter amanitiformis]MDQ0512751.1 hypothetical protein [Ancylobacter amanitiformis]
MAERRLERVEVAVDGVATQVLVDLEESPLGWLARRRGRNGSALVGAAQLVAGERLRADFTRAQMMPRLTADWEAVGRSGRRGPSAGLTPSEAALAARQRVSAALEAAGPEFAGLLTDVCCFLKGLEQVEQDRGWPARTAKVVLGLGLDRLARHYGLAVAARGPERAGPIRAWSAEGRPSL